MSLNSNQAMKSSAAVAVLLRSMCVRVRLAVALKPASMSFEDAASVNIAGITALQALRDKGKVQPGQRVLVNGAAGGVGTFAVQIAKSLGADVTGVCSTRNVDLVRSIGADDVIDYTRDDFTRTGRRYDLVLDLVGNRSLTDCRRAVAPTGILVLGGGGLFQGGSFLGPVGLIIRAQLVSPLVGHRLRVLTARPSR